MITVVLFILFTAVNSEEWDCTVTNNVMSCQDGECQHKINGWFEYTDNNLKTTGKTVRYGGSDTTVYCPLIIESNSELRGVNKWKDFDGIVVNENVNASFNKGKYSVINHFTFHKNSFVKLEYVFSIGCPIVIEGYRESNTPLISCFKCSYLDLHRQNNTTRPFNWMNVTYRYGNCVDIISLHSSQPITNGYKENRNHALNVDDFPIYNLGLYLLSNQKLIRYCPGELDNNVECSITKYYYNTKVSSPDFSFDYPHCPCEEDETTTCSLTTSLNKISFGSNKITQQLNVYKDLTIENSDDMNDVFIMNDSVKLTISNSKIQRMHYKENRYVSISRKVYSSIIEILENVINIQMRLTSDNAITINSNNDVIKLDVRSQGSNSHSLSINTEGKLIILYSIDDLININNGSEELLFIASNKTSKSLNYCSCLYE